MNLIAIIKINIVRLYLMYTGILDVCRLVIFIIYLSINIKYIRETYSFKKN